MGPAGIPSSSPLSAAPSPPAVPSCLISSPCSQRRPAGARGQGQTKASLLTAPPRKGLFFSPSLFFSSPSPPSLGRGHGLISTGARWMEQQMAARRPRGTDARPARGRLTGPGGSGTAGLPAGLPPRQHTPHPCPDTAGTLGNRGSQRQPEVGMAKSRCRGHRRSAAALCILGGYRDLGTAVPCLLLPCPSAAGRTRCQQHPDSSPRSPATANYGLIPPQQRIPPPPRTAHPGGLRVKAQIPGAALM